MKDYDKIIKEKEAELKQLKKERFRVENKQEIEDNIRISKMKIEWIKKHFEEYKRPKVQSAFDSMDEDFVGLSTLEYEKKTQQFTFFNPVIHSEKHVFPSNYGPHRIIGQLKVFENTFLLCKKSDPSTYRFELLKRQFGTGKLPDGFHVASMSPNHVGIRFKRRNYEISRTRGWQSSKKPFTVSNTIDFDFGDLAYLFRKVKDVEITTDNPLETIKRIHKDLEALHHLIVATNANNLVDEWQKNNNQN